MIKEKYIKTVQKILVEDAMSKNDISPNGIIKIYEISEKYHKQLEQYLIDAVIHKAKWIEEYLMHCRHMNRPLDMKLINNLINSLYYI